MPNDTLTIEAKPVPQITHKERYFCQTLAQQIQKNGVDSVGAVNAIEDLEPDKVRILVKALRLMANTGK